MKPNADDPCAECGMSYREHDPDDFVPIGHEPTVSFAALLPPGTVAVLESEIAALREFASAVLAHEAMVDESPTMGEHNASVDRVRAAIDGLRVVGFVPGDRAPLPEEGP